MQIGGVVFVSVLWYIILFVFSYFIISVSKADAV